MNTEFINIAAYKFIDLDNLAERKSLLLPLCRSLELKGTILLSSEGINMFLAGSRHSIDTLLNHLRSQPEFVDLPIKESVSDHQPFSRMLVRLKKEIISMGVETIEPLKKTSPKISATQLKKWLDEGKELTLLDVRNDYEVEVGTFSNAVPVGIDHFRKFPEATKQLPSSMKSKPIVMFCTGGIRCEKAGPLMEEEGFQEVYQLDGGILGYLSEIPPERSRWRGECFVFDRRVSLGHGLCLGTFAECFGCKQPVSESERSSPEFEWGVSCPNCHEALTDERRASLRERCRQVKLARDSGRRHIG